MISQIEKMVTHKTNIIYNDDHNNITFNELNKYTECNDL